MYILLILRNSKQKICLLHFCLYQHIFKHASEIIIDHQRISSKLKTHLEFSTPSRNTLMLVSIKSY
jgi:hypothetical protein